MLKIVVAIDFSDCSINAFLHAVSIAQHCKSDINLVWVQKPVTQKEKFVEQESDPIREVKRAFEELIAKHQPDLPDNKITYKIRVGKIYKEVTQEAKESKATLIVVGTHGASGFEEFWIGSNANKIVAASSCPVITIRGGINIQRPLTRIVFPIDSAEETRQKSTFTAYLAKKHDAEIFVLKLYSSKLKAMRQNVDRYTTQVCGYFDEEKVKYSVDAVDTLNISDAMIDYAKMIDANMIAIMTEQETTATNIILGPYAHQTVNHSPIPVLSIHPKETLSGGVGM
jgi:nucleotide-binding universal stress UspA family protein